MNKTKKFMTFVESIVEDKSLLSTIRSGFNACLESLEYEGGDEWTIDIEELEYPIEIATKYFKLNDEIHKYKEETGEEVGKEDITVGARVTSEYEFSFSPYYAASMEGPEEGGAELEDQTIRYIELTLYIAGNDVGTVEIEDEEALKNLDPVLDAAIEKELDRYTDEITSKTESRVAENAAADRAEARYADRYERDYY